MKNFGFKFRDGQYEAATTAANYLKLHNREPAILVLPTAFGKSIVIAEIVNQLQPCHILILQEDSRILEQNKEKILSFVDKEQVGVFCAGLQEKEIKTITLATIQSIKSIANDINHFDYIIIDECHNASVSKDRHKPNMYQKLINTVFAKGVIGLTATPYYNKPSYTYGASMYQEANGSHVRLQTKAGLFRKILFVENTKTMVDKGYLQSITYNKIHDPDGSMQEQLISSLKSSSTGDYTGASMEQLFSKNDYITRVVRSLVGKLESHKSMIIFVPTIVSAMKLEYAIKQYIKLLPSAKKEVYRDKLIECIHGKKEQSLNKNIIQRFKKGEVSMLINVGMLTTGFDAPRIDFIGMLRPTLSLALYQQMIGRGMRVAPDKTFCTYVDYVGNVDRFGRVEDIEIKKDDKGHYQIYGKLPSGATVDGLKVYNTVRFSGNHVFS